LGIRGEELGKEGGEETTQAEADGKHQPPPLPVTPECQQGPTPGCCEYNNIFPFSQLFKVSITFLISFRLPLFRLYYLETMDIFPTFLSLNMLLQNPYLMKGTLGTCSECIRNFPLLASHV
jgi:hypothetical protein